MYNSVFSITYGGFLDPLGRCQILPYLRSIACHPRALQVVSCEKPGRFFTKAEKLPGQLTEADIGWALLFFTSRFGKVWDFLRMYGVAIRFQLRRSFSLIHCRSYQAMQVGVLLSRLTGTRTIFEVQDLRVDKRVDGGQWAQDRWMNRVAYRIYKHIEKRLLIRAHHVMLTDRVVPELCRLSVNTTTPILVIPWCVDFDDFVVPGDAARQTMRAELLFPHPSAGTAA